LDAAAQGRAIDEDTLFGIWSGSAENEEFDQYFCEF
jgi:hypothetical protein